jgi:hypothetical protein
MIFSVLLPLVLLAAIAAMARRRWRRAALARAAGEREGGSPERAIYVRSFAEIDDHLAARWCVCGGYLERTGEGSRDAGVRRYRIARLCCQECERTDEVFFDTTEIVH